MQHHCCTSCSATRPVHASRTSAGSQSPSSTSSSRRRASALLFQVPLLLAVGTPADAKPPPPTNKEADNTSPYIQGLLAKSIEKRDERAKEMLKQYMKKNYKEYFDFEAGGNTKRGLSPETMKSIQKWLADNP